MIAAASHLEGLADALATASSIVGGGAVLGGVLWFVAASVLQDLGYAVEPLRAAQYGAQLGGIFGLVTMAFATLDTR